MEIGVARDERDKCEAGPFPTAVGQGEQRDEQRENPDLANETVEAALAKLVAAPRKEEHGDDLQRGRRDGEHVGLEGGEAQTAEGQGQVALHRGGRDVGYQADEEETPEGGVAECILDVLPGDWFFECREALGWVVAEDAVHHDDLLALRVPGLAEEEAIGLRRGGREVEEGLRVLAGECMASKVWVNVRWHQGDQSRAPREETAKTIPACHRCRASRGCRPPAGLR